jgi:4-amino-4-deoxy-L-arabinose transferase-like glycosyltransferase
LDEIILAAHLTGGGVSRRVAGFVLGAELLLGLALRAVGLGSRPIWYDDAFSVLLSRQSLGAIVRGTAADTMPPLYYFLLHAWMTVATSIAGWRLLNVLLSLGVIYLVFAIARLLFDEHVALLAALFAAVSPIQIYQAQELRMYTLLTLGLSAYIWGIVEATRAAPGRDRWYWAAVVVGGIVAAYSHNLAAFTLFAPDVYFLVRREWSTLRRLLLAQVVVAVVWAPWLLMLPGQIAKIQAAFWTPRPGLLEVVQGILILHGYLPLQPPSLQGFLLVFSILAPALTILTLVRLRASRDVGLLAAVAVVPPAALFAISYIMRPVFVARAFLPSGLAYLILAALAAVRNRSALVRLTISGCVLASAAVSLPAQMRFRSFPRSPFPQAAAYLRSQVEPGSVVVHDNKLSAFPLILYAPELDQSFLPDEPGSPNDTLAAATEDAMGLFPVDDIESVVGGARTVFFVVFQRAIDEYRAAGLADHPQLAWLRAHFRDEAVTTFEDLSVYAFSR